MNIRILERKFDNISIVNDRNSIIYGSFYAGINSIKIRDFYFDDFTNKEFIYVRDNVRNLPVIHMEDYKNEFYFNNFSSREEVIDLLIDNNIDFIQHYNAHNMTVIKSREPLSNSIVTMMKLLGA